MKTVKAVVLEGHRVASGTSQEDKRFPGGTIRMQKPFFKERGLDFDAYLDGDFIYGMLNLSIAPHSFKIAKPEFFFPEVKWTDVFPPENFFLSAAEVMFRGRGYKALIYIPDPATKPDHFHDLSVIEVIAQRIEGIAYGDEVELGYTIQAQEELLKEVHEALQRVQKQYRDDSHVPMFKIDVRGNTIAEIHRVDPDFLEEFRYTLNNALEPFKERLTIAPNDFPRTVAGRQEKQGYTDCKVGETNKGYALELILEGLSLDGEPLMNKNNYYIAIGDSSGDKPTFEKIKELVDAGKAKGATLVSIGDKLRDIADLVFDGEGNIPFNLEHDYLKALIKYMDFYYEFHNVEPRPDKPVVTSSKVADRGPKAG